MEDQQEEDSLVNQMAPGSDHDLPQSEAVDDDDLSPLISFNTCPGTSPAGNRLRYPRRLGRLGLRGRGLGGAGGQGLGSPGVEVDASEAAAATRRMPGVALSFSDTAESLWDRFGTPEAPRSVLMARAPALGKGPGIAPESRVEDEAIDGIDDGPDAIRTVPESGVEHGRGFVDRGLVADDGGNRNDPDDEVRVQNEVVVCEDDGQLEACDVHIIGKGGPGCCHPKSTCYRITGLVLMCLLGFGAYFCFDNPGALQGELKESMHISTYQFASLYAFYAWPNAFLPICGGYLMDGVFGMRLSTCLFAAFIIIGQILFAMGGINGNLNYMKMGRFIFGVGGESLQVAQNTYAVAWFQGDYLNMVFGFQLSIARVGSAINFQVMGPLYEYIKNHYGQEGAMGWTLLIAGLTCVMSFICSIILGFMDKRAERFARSKEQQEEKKEKMKVMDILAFPLSFWLLSLIVVLYYAAIFTYVSLGQQFYVKKFNFSPSNANFINGFIYLLSAPLAPLLGILIDKTGRNLTYVFVAITLTILGHFMLALTDWNPYVAVVVVGFAYSLLASSLWPIAALIIPENQLGTAYGIMQAIQNAGSGGATLLAGLIVDTHGYLWLELFFIGLLILAQFLTCVIWIMDMKGTGYFNMNIPQRVAYLAERKSLAAVAAAEKEAKAAAAREASRPVVMPPPVLKPKTADQVRERYLRKIGAGLPPHLGHSGLNVVMQHNDGQLRPVFPTRPISMPAAAAENSPDRVIVPHTPSYC